MDEILDHVLEVFHVSEYGELDRICELVDGVCGERRDRWPDLCRELSVFWFEFVHEILSHFRKEEEILFPLMRRIVALGSGPPLANGPLRVMLREHDAAEEGLATLRRITSEYQPPEHADAEMRVLFAALSAFDDRLRAHIEFENRVLFPRFQ